MKNNPNIVYIHTPEWERIEQVISYSGEKSLAAFARRIGLPRGENLHQIKRGNNGISRKLAESINAEFPEFDKLWLLTGESEKGPTAIHIKNEEKDITLHIKISFAVE